MRAVVAEIVDTHSWLQTVWVSLAAGLGVTLAFSLAVLGLARAPEARAGPAIR